MDVLHNDLAALLRALGMGDHARPKSPHEVMREAIAGVELLKTSLERTRNAFALKDFPDFSLREEIRSQIIRNAAETFQLTQQLSARVEVLENAIKTHRSQKADDRCIEDDDALYAALGDGVKCDRRVGDKEAMLANCKRFIERRCEGGWWPSYVQLEEALACARKDANDVRARLWKREEDLRIASETFMVPLPEPGTAMAKLMISERIMKGERDAAKEKVHEMADQLHASESLRQDFQRQAARFAMHFNMSLARESETNEKLKHYMTEAAKRIGEARGEVERERETGHKLSLDSAHKIMRVETLERVLLKAQGIAEDAHVDGDCKHCAESDSASACPALCEIEDAIVGMKPIDKEQWLVWSTRDRIWWKPNRGGYTSDQARAGRYTLKEALRCAGMRSREHDGTPAEVVVPAPEAYS
jgi:hypothetical protein